MPPHLFDPHLRALRRDRAARIGSDLFLFERAFEDCLDRLRDIPRQYDRALLIGCPSPEWPARLSALARSIDTVDPGALFARQASGIQVDEDRFVPATGKYDMVVAIGTLDTVNDLPGALRNIANALKPHAPLIGAIAGGNSLPALRAALMAAGRHHGRIVPRTHPRIDAATLGQLLASTGFHMPVIDVDRVRLRYTSLEALVRDLRAMAATSVLEERAPPLSKAELSSTHQEFLAQGCGGRTEEVVEILHFLAWTK